MWAWVRIPLLTYFFSYPPKLPFWIKKNKKIVATAGNRTPINCLEGNYANHYTTVAVAETLTDIQSVSFYSCVWEQNDSGEFLKPLSGWPSGLRRQTQGCDPSTTTVAEGFLVHKCGLGFKSHFWHIFFFSFSFLFIIKKVATAGNRTPINCLEGNYANHYTTVAVGYYLSNILCKFFFKRQTSLSFAYCWYLIHSFESPTSDRHKVIWICFG